MIITNKQRLPESLMNACQTEMHNKASAKEDEQDILNELSKAPLLVIDEVGKQFGSESERNWLSYVIDERYELDIPIILVSNLKPMRFCSDDEKAQGAYLERYLGRDSVSRLAETADIKGVRL